MKRVLAPLFLFCVVLFSGLAGCGGNNSNGGNNTSGPISARVNGASWSAGNLTAAASGVTSVPGGLVITGTQLSGGVVSTITFNLYNITGPGTFALGVLPMVFGGTATFAEGSDKVWMTPLSGAAGTITITSLTATHVAGTFQFTAEPGLGSAATGTRAVTAGEFDLPLTTPVPAVPDGKGSGVTATLNGSAYTGSTIVVTQQGAGGFGFSSTNEHYSVTLYLVSVTAAGTYTPSTSPLRGVVVVDLSAAGANKPTWGLTATDTGSIVLTSLTATRARGSFNLTLGPESNGGGATGTLTVVGNFDIGLQ